MTDGLVHSFTVEESIIACIQWVNVDWMWRGLSGGAMVLDKLPVPGRPTYFDLSRASAYCACSRCGWGLF